LNSLSRHGSFARIGVRLGEADRSHSFTERPRRSDPITRILWGLLVFSLPFDDIYFPEAARGFGQPSTYLAIVLWVLVLLKILWGKEGLRFLKSKALLFVFLFWFVAGASISQVSQAPPSPWFGSSPWRTGGEQFVQLSLSLSIAFLTAYFVQSWRDVRFAMTLYFAGWIGSVLAQVLDFAAYFSNWAWLQTANDFIHYHPWQFLGPLPRLRLSTAEASWASDYLIGVIPFFVLRAYYWKSRRWNLANAFATILVLFATMSFGGLAVFVGEVALMAVILGRRAVGFLALAGAAPLLLALAISPVYVSSVWDRAVGAYAHGTQSEDGSLRARAALADAAWSAFEEHPWLGVGIGVSPYYVPGGMPTWVAADPEVKMYVGALEGGNVCSLHLEVLSETGLAGTGIFMLLFATMVLGTFKAYRGAPEPWKKSVYAAILVSLVGQFAHYTSMNRFHFHYWFFIWGLATSAVSLVGQPDPAVLALRATYGRKFAGRLAPAAALALRVSPVGDRR
jgi:O-antigen ligase